MNKHYDNYLVRKYAPLYKERYLPMTHTCMCWGFDVGDGWFNIINNLSRALCSEWLYANRDYVKIVGRVGELVYKDSSFNSKYNPVITQEMIDEKKSIMDAEYDKVPTVTQVKEKFGTLRFYTNGTTDVQEAYIRYAELMTANTCEICGKPGKANNGGWISVRCKEHRHTH